MDQLVHRLGSNTVGPMSHIEGQSSFAWDHVRRAWLHFDSAHRCHQTRHFASRSLYCINPFGCARKRIVSKIHWCRTSVIRTAYKCEFQTTLPNNCLNRRKRLSQLFQNWSLLDVKLKVTQSVVLQNSFSYLLRIQAKIIDGLANGNSLPVCMTQEFSV